MDETQDLDPVETREWLDALEGVIEVEGSPRAAFLLDALLGSARQEGVPVPYSATMPYLNTIPPEQEPKHPGDRAIEHKIRSIIRWNALAIVLRANKESSELGGHIASFQSAATLYDTGFTHFWRAPGERHGGDLVYIQGHSSPGIYARSFLEGRLSEEQLLDFREEVDGGGLSSYPHPWLMPDYWQFPTVSMGLGPFDPPPPNRSRPRLGSDQVRQGREVCRARVSGRRRSSPSCARPTCCSGRARGWPRWSRRSG